MHEAGCNLENTTNVGKEVERLEPSDTAGVK